MNRRKLLATGGAGLAASLLSQAGVRVAWAAEKSRKRVIYVFLRGGFDVLSLLPPADPNQKVGGVPFRTLRPSQLITPVDAHLRELTKAKELPAGLESLAALTGLDASPAAVRERLRAFAAAEQTYVRATGGNFNLHPGLHPLTEALDKRHLSFVLHTGSQHATRSHFTQQDLIDSGSARQIQPKGFLAQVMNQKAFAGRTALALGQKVPRSLKGFDAALIDTIQDAADKSDIKKILSSQLSRGERLNMFDAGKTVPDEVAEFVPEARDLAAILATYAEPMAGVDSAQAVRRRFRFAAELVKRAGTQDLNPAVVTLDVWGWDTHGGQNADGYEAGDLGGKIAVLASELARLRTSLIQSGEWDNTMVVVMSEFGRTIAENASNGTDHGHGSAMILMGPNLNRKHGHSTWNFAQVDGGENSGSAALTAPVDYRQVMAQVLRDHLGVADVKKCFDGYTPVAIPLFG